MKKTKTLLFFLITLLIIIACSFVATASEESTAAYRYTVNGETVEAEHIDGTMDLSDVISAADANTTIYVLRDIEIASGPTTESYIIDVKKNLTIDLGGNTLSIKQNGKNYIRTSNNVTATWQNGVIIASRTDDATKAHPIFRFPSRTSPTLNLINIKSYTGGLIGSYSGQSITVNITGGEHHMVLKSDLNFNALFHARAGTKITATDASFYVGEHKLISAISNKTTDGNYNHSYSFTNCNIIGSSATTNLIGESNECVTASFIGCNIVGSINPSLHSWDSSADRAAMKSGSLTLGEDTCLSNGSTVASGLAVYPEGYTLGSINEDKDFTLAYSSGTIYDKNFVIANATKTFNFASKVCPVDAVKKTSETLIDLNTEWKYIDDNTDPASGLNSLSAWTLPSFDDGAWKTGVGSFGAKSGQLGAINGKTPNVLLTHYITGTSTCIPSYFFRTEINIYDANEISALYLNANADDGVVIYINGHAILDTRSETPSTTTNLQYYNGVWENILSIAAANLEGVLVDGSNTIAVQLHNNQSGSSDLYFAINELTVYYPETNPTPATQVVLGVGSNETERAVSWLSSSPLNGEVRLALESEIVNNEFPENYKSFTAVSEIATNKVGFYALDAVITGLLENTSYAYQIVMPNGKSDIYYFDTGSFGDYNFVFVGDPQISTEAHGTAWDDTLNKITSQFDSELLISAGDQIVTPTDEAQYVYFINDKLSSIAFAPSVGPVHDDPSKSFKDHFYTPNASSTYGVTISSSNYWYTYNNTLFMHLNMADKSAYQTEHRAFIEETLAANPDVKWKIVIMHNSLFSTGMHGDPNYSYYDSEIGLYLPNMAPMFTELGIDVVLSGHDHVYLRTYMMNGIEKSGDLVENNTVTNPVGTLFLCASSSTGSKFYSQTYEADFAAYDNYEKRKSAIKFEVTDTSLTLTSYFLDDMSVFDSFTINRATVEPITVTWTAVDGTVLGTSTAVPGYTAQVPENLSAVGTLVDGWLDYVPDEWETSLLIPSDAEEYTIVAKEGGKVKPIANIDLLFNSNMQSHFQYNLYIPTVPEDSGISVTKVTLNIDRTNNYKTNITRTILINGKPYNYTSVWPGLKATLNESTIEISFTYEEQSYTVSSTIDMTRYCSYIVDENNAYSEAAKKLATNVANYIYTGNVVLENTSAKMAALNALILNNTTRLITPDESALTLPNSTAISTYISGVQLIVVDYGPYFKFNLTDAGIAADFVRLSTGHQESTDTKEEYSALGYIETNNTYITSINSTKITIEGTDISVTYTLANYIAELRNKVDANTLAFLYAMYGYAMADVLY